MKEITNKHLLITMIVIAVITIGILLSHGRMVGYSVPSTSYNYDTSTLGASVYDAYNISYSGSPTTSLVHHTRYIPVIHTSYPITTSQYYYKTVPSYQQSYYSSSQNYYSNTEGSSYGSYSADVPPGCETGQDYSTTTGEPCG